ncbi:type IIL restriction-modification enzyme MmeI [Corynebacterium casei]|uniref:type IIL restriction-modification enzyme MmeI n=1 Tax=Corynebacterium casei TaxID=160386 RepID=UPI0034532840
MDGPWVLIEPRRTPLSSVLSPVINGSEPREGGNLMVGEEDYERLKGDPILSKYLRPFVAGAELVRGTRRWCLWLTNLDPSDIERSPELRERLEDVRKMERVKYFVCGAFGVSAL